jgi:hypothetical protein
MLNISAAVDLIQAAVLYKGFLLVIKTPMGPASRRSCRAIS